MSCSLPSRQPRSNLASVVEDRGSSDLEEDPTDRGPIAGVGGSVAGVGGSIASVGGLDPSDLASAVAELSRAPALSPSSEAEVSTAASAKVSSPLSSCVVADGSLLECGLISSLPGIGSRGGDVPLTDAVGEGGAESMMGVMGVGSGGDGLVEAGRSGVVELCSGAAVARDR
ncbi:hypothetical protein Dimus_012472 [Dionaea muscipula]